jgi:hypothetical protein
MDVLGEENPELEIERVLEDREALAPADGRPATGDRRRTGEPSASVVGRPSPVRPGGAP